MGTAQQWKNRLTRCVVALTAAGATLGTGAARAQANDLCIPAIGGLAGTPTIDGVVGSFSQPVRNDLGWNNAYRVNLSADMGVTRAAAMQMGRTGTDVHVAFSIGAPAPGADNTIVLALSTTTSSAQDWRIHIKPFDNSTFAINKTDAQPLSVTYWRDSSKWNGTGTGAANTAATLLDDDATGKRVRFSRVGGTGVGAGYWEIEIRIPIETNATSAGSNSKVYFPSSGTFSLYANVLSTSSVTGTHIQDPWPPGRTVSPPAETVSGTSKLLTRNTPTKDKWGTASFNQRDDACTGVSLQLTDVGVKNPSMTSAIIGDIRAVNSVTHTLAQCLDNTTVPNGYLWDATKGLLNTFVAKPLNGMGADAKVGAKFYVADWGISSEWSEIGELAGGRTLVPPTVTLNPTAEALITNGLKGDLISTWQLSYRQSCLYLRSNGGHHCIQVELESSDPATRFLNKSVQRNMDFVPASMFSRDAQISAKGRGPAPPGRSQHEVLLMVESAVQDYVRDGDTYFASGQRTGVRYPEFKQIAAANFPKGMNQATTWIARGYLKRGTTVNINGTDYEYAEYMGGFGYIAGHAGPVNIWRAWLEGALVAQPVGDGNVYVLQVPVDGRATVKTTIFAVGPGDPDPGANPPVGGSLANSKWAVWAALGSTFPHGSFSNLHKSGFAGTLGVEYALNATTSIEGTLGTHRFKSKGVAADVDATQIGLNGKWYFAQPGFRPFLTLGAGAYAFDPGSTRFGLNAGAGIQFDIAPQLSLEGRYVWHRISGNAPNTSYSTLQLGLRYSF